MLKSKIDFRVAWDSPKAKLDWYSTNIHTYGIQIADNPIDLAETNPSKNISVNWLNKKGPRKWRNITASKNQAMQSMFLIWASLGTSQGDAINFYNKALFLPSYSSLGYTSSLTGVKKPIGAKYPALIDFDSIGFCSKLLAYKSYASKSNIYFSQTYKQHLIQSSSTIIANFITKQDKLYLNPLDYNFYHIDTNEKYTGVIPDEQIFRPFTSDYQKSKQEILRLWNDFKYYGSNLMLPKFLPNEEKKQNYLNSLVNENEELISVEQLNYENVNKDDLIRLVLQETLGEYYDGNDNFTFTIFGNTYSIDIENECFLDSEGNVIPYIAKYDANNTLESILSFKEYKSIIKETFNAGDNIIQQHIVNVLKNDLDISLLTAPNWNMYEDVDKNGNKYNWYGNKYRLEYWWGDGVTYEDRAILNYTFSELQNRVLSLGTNQSIEDIACKTTYNSFLDGTESYKVISGSFIPKGGGITINYNISVNRGLSNQIIDLKIRKFDSILSLINNVICVNSSSLIRFFANLVDNNTGFWSNPNAYYYWNGFSELYAAANGNSFFNQYSQNAAKCILQNIQYLLNNKNATEVKLPNEYSWKNEVPFTFKDIRVKGLDFIYSGESIYEYKDNSYSIKYDTTKELVKTYYFRDIILEVFGGIYTCLEGLDKSNADYNTIQTYFRETDYQDGEEYDTVTIAPIFTINGVISNANAKLNTNELTYSKVLDKEGEYTDNNGNKYSIKEVGITYEPPQEFSVNTLDEEGNEVIKTETISESFQPRNGLYDINIKQLVKFSLPPRELKIYVKMANYITKLKTNQINGYLIKYKDLTDNKIKVRLHEETEISYLQNTNDLDKDIVKCLPLIPLWTQTVTIDWIQSKIIEVLNPLSWAGNWKAVNRYNNFLGFRSDIENLKGFYQFYDKKINKYYKDALNFYLKEWEQQINGEYEDKEYNVKMKKLSNRFKNEKSIVYSQSIFSKPKDSSIYSDYNSYRSNASAFGYHTAIRFSFAIYFNKHFRKTKLLCKMGYQYLDYFYKRLNGTKGVWIEQSIYPPDRIQFAEKMLFLKFKKENYNLEEEGNEASYYCVFKGKEGQFIFYNRTKKEKFTFDINRHLPNWRNIYFSGINTYTYGSDLSKLSAEDRLGLYTITKNDIQTKNVKLEGKTIIARSLYYNTKSNLGSQSFNTWSRGYDNVDYACFYMPHSSDLNHYKFNEAEIIDTLSNFNSRNVYDYIYGKLKKYSITEIKDMYLKVFNKEIEVLPITNNIFNYDGLFDDLVISSVNLDLFNSSDESQISKELDFNHIPYGDIPALDAVGVAVTQSYWLNTQFDKSNLLSETIDTDTQKSLEIAIKEIIYYLLDNDLPRTKYVLPQEFRQYFINYDTNSMLAQIFTDYEIYQIGFNNFLVTNEVDNYELTILLEKIMDISKRLVFNTDLKAGTFDYNSAWLPMPVNVYKKLPIYCKNFVSSVMYQLEYYSCSVIPTVDKKSADLVLTYQCMQIITAIILTIVSLVLSCVDGGSSAPGAIAFLVISIAGMVVSIVSLILQLIILVLPSDRVKGLKKATQILGYIGMALSFASAFNNGINPSSMQIANMIIKSIDWAIQIADKIVTLYYTQAQLNKNREYNLKVDEYNKSQEGMNKFIEDYEFEAELLNQYQPLNITQKENSIYDMNIEAGYDLFIEHSLNMLYDDLDSYYSNRGL